MVEIFFAQSFDDLSFYQVIMANASILYDSARKGLRRSETAESAKHLAISIHTLSKRLQDPVDCVSEGILGAVIGLACHDVCLLFRAPGRSQD